MKYEGNIRIKPTDGSDLPALLRLWNSGEVMRFCGFPDGLGTDAAHMESWLCGIERDRPRRDHFSIYANGLGYCGESYYAIDAEHGALTAVDIKLLPDARGKGIARAALSHALNAAFANGALRAYVDPDPLNGKALALYAKLGFKPAVKPASVIAGEGDEYASSPYFELTAADWLRAKNTP